MSSGLRSRGRKPDAAKRAAIVKAARDEFFAVGFGGTTIENIAARAGVSKVTVYNHFGDKQGIFSAAVEGECEKIRDQLLDDDPRVPLHDRLMNFGRSMIAFLERPEMIAFEHRLAAETKQHPDLGERFLEAGPRRMHRALAGLLDRAARRGEIIPANSHVAAEQLASMFKGLSDIERRFGTPTSRDDTETRLMGAVDTFLRAYGR